MATSLGKVGIVDKGNYSSEEIYNSGDFIFYEGSTWLALKNGLMGIEPAEGENWKYLARGLSNGIATPDKVGVVKPNNDFTIEEDGTLGINPIVLEEYVEKPIQKSLTIPNTGWTSETNGPYTQKLVLAVEGITVNTIVNVTIALASEEIAQDCGLASTNESGEGTITFYAESAPSAAMQATYYVLDAESGEIGATVYRAKTDLEPIEEEIQEIKNKVDGQTDVINNLDASLGNLIAKIDGFVAKKIEFLEDGTIKETSGTAVKTTVFLEDGSIKETLVDGEESITKVTRFLVDGSIEESIQEESV